MFLVICSLDERFVSSNVDFELKLYKMDLTPDKIVFHPLQFTYQELIHKQNGIRLLFFFRCKQEMLWVFWS